jgi:hypothetical protein
MAVATAGINKSGHTKYTMVSSRDVSGTSPAGNEYVYVEMADNSGTGDDRYLAIVTQAPGFAAMF